MASQSPSHPRTPHHVPGIPLTYAIPSATNTPYHPYNTPPKSPPSPSYNRNYSSHSSSDPHAQQIALLQETINRLQLIDSSRAEAITELKIQLAIQKNDLHYAREKIVDKDAVISSLGSVIGSLTRGASVTPETETKTLASENTEGGKKRISELEKEIERYRKSDRQLRSRIRHLERGVEAGDRHDDTGHLEGERSIPVYSNGSFEGGHTIRVYENYRLGNCAVEQGWKVDKGKGKIVERDVGLGLGSVNLLERQQPYRPVPLLSSTALQPSGSWGEKKRNENSQTQAESSAPSKYALDEEKINTVECTVDSGRVSANSPPSQQTYRHTTLPGPSASQLVGSWGSSPNTSTELSTIPNTPVESSSFDPSNIDIGVCSLEDFFDNDGYPPLSFPPPLSGKPASLPSLPSTAHNSFPAPSTAACSTYSSTVRAVQEQSQEQDQIPKIEEDDRPIDEQISSNQKAMAQFINMPTPGTIKTGFVLSGTYRGADYSNPPTPQPLRNFDRFAPRNPNSPSYSNFNPPSAPGQFMRTPPTGPRAMFEKQQDCPYAFDSTLWIDAQDRNGAVEQHTAKSNGRGDTRFPDFFRYGIQFVPGEKDGNYFRTVMIGNLPLGTTILDVLARVRGGEVLSCAVVNMAGCSPGTVAARVVFKQEADAEAYVSYASTPDHPLRFSENDNLSIASISLVPTPTYPSSSKTQLRLDSQTRCLALSNIPFNFSINALEHNLACGNQYRAKGLLEMYVDEQFTLHLEFSSVELANSAFNILQTRNGYRDLRCSFEVDPCAGSVEELAVKLRPRPKLFPDNWAGNMIGKSGGESGDIDIEGGEEVESRKQLAALGKQKVVIPDFAKDDSFAKVVISARYAGESESEGSGNRSSGEGSKVLAGDGDTTHGESSSCAPVDGSLASKEKLGEEIKSENLDEGTQNGRSEYRHESAIPTSQSATIEINTTLKVLTIEQELQAALLTSKANKITTTSSSTSHPFLTPHSITSSLPSQTPLTGLAASKYASPPPPINNTDRQPRSFNRNTSAVSFTFPSSPPTSSIEPSVYPSRLSNSPPRVDLDDLIKSNRSSFASRGSGSGEIVRDEDENEVEVKDGDRTDDVVEEEQIEEVAVKPRVQLFSWTKIPRVAGGGCGKKRGLGDGAEQLTPSATRNGNVEVEVEQALAGEKVVNPDEINLDDDDNENIAEEEDKSTEVASGPISPPANSSSPTVVGKAEEIWIDIKIEDKTADLRTNPANKLTTILENVNDDEKSTDVTQVAKKGEGCCSA
ncbi:hypothetical protein VTL71DRAFT_11953 [Oculimacula yallundae]|uniref:Uncharacterized protein n=1 Tax=Oculimacula yallundae TaxID=86028 RepID=A0ABR4CRW9_9HELO